MENESHGTRVARIGKPKERAFDPWATDAPTQEPKNETHMPNEPPANISHGGRLAWQQQKARERQSTLFNPWAKK